VLIFVVLKEFWLLGFHTTMGDRHGIGWLHEEYYDAAIKRLREAAKELDIENI